MANWCEVGNHETSWQVEIVGGVSCCPFHAQQIRVGDRDPLESLSSHQQDEDD